MTCRILKFVLGEKPFPLSSRSFFHIKKSTENIGLRQNISNVRMNSGCFLRSLQWDTHIEEEFWFLKLSLFELKIENTSPTTSSTHIASRQLFSYSETLFLGFLGREVLRIASKEMKQKKSEKEGNERECKRRRRE